MNKEEAKKAGEEILKKIKKVTGNARLQLRKFNDGYEPVISLLGGNGSLYHSQMSGAWVAGIYKETQTNGHRHRARIISETATSPELAVMKLIKSCAKQETMFIKLVDLSYEQKYRRDTI